MNAALQFLVAEHEKILQTVLELEKICSQLKTGAAIDQVFFGESIDFIQNYADAFHHAKEEKILFVELEKPGVLAHCNPVPQMLREHEEGRRLAREMRTALRQNDREKLMAASLGYATLLREHIMKEDQILYPMAEEALSPEVKKTIEERFAVADKEWKNDGAKFKIKAENAKF